MNPLALLIFFPLVLAGLAWAKRVYLRPRMMWLALVPAAAALLQR